jgi:hypothetical protein
MNFHKVLILKNEKVVKTGYKSNDNKTAIESYQDWFVKN